MLISVPVILPLQVHENGPIQTHKGLDAFTRIRLSCICVMGTEHFHIYAFSSARSACFYQQKQTPSLKMQSLPISMRGGGVPSLSENALQKHKTAGHRGYYRAGLHSQDDVTRDGGLEHPWGTKVSPDAPELGIKP